jgi:hypothetical protein
MQSIFPVKCSWVHYAEMSCGILCGLDLAQL